MPISAKPYRHKTFATVKGKRMAYIEANTGNAIVYATPFRASDPKAVSG